MRLQERTGNGGLPPCCNVAHCRNTPSKSCVSAFLSVSQNSITKLSLQAGASDRTIFTFPLQKLIYAFPTCREDDYSCHLERKSSPYTTTWTCRVKSGVRNACCSTKQNMKCVSNIAIIHIHAAKHSSAPCQLHASIECMMGHSDPDWAAMWVPLNYYRLNLNFSRNDFTPSATSGHCYVSTLNANSSHVAWKETIEITFLLKYNISLETQHSLIASDYTAEKYFVDLLKLFYTQECIWTSWCTILVGRHMLLSHNHSHSRAEARESKVQDLSRLQSEFKATLVTLCDLVPPKDISRKKRAVNSRVSASKHKPIGSISSTE